MPSINLFNKEITYNETIDEDEEYAVDGNDTPSPKKKPSFKKNLVNPFIMSPIKHRGELSPGLNRDEQFFIEIFEEF
jgi:hypothetical protein